MRNLLSRADIKFLRDNRELVSEFINCAERNLEFAGGSAHAYLCTTLGVLPPPNISEFTESLMKILFKVFSNRGDSFGHDSAWISVSLNKIKPDLGMDYKVANGVRATMLCFLINVMEEI